MCANMNVYTPYKTDASTQALRAYYQHSAASQYDLNEALDALVTLTDRSQKLVHVEQQKKFLELSKEPMLLPRH